MSHDPRASMISPDAVRAQARRQARPLSGGLLAALGGAAALMIVAAVALLDYKFNQDAHRLFKLVLGLAGVGVMVTVPRFGLFLLPIAVPFLGWLPKIPVPMLNAVNVLVFAVFFAWLAPRIMAREHVLRGGRLGPVLGVFVLVTLVALGRGIAFPVTTYYSASGAFMLWFRCSVPFFIFFMGLAMLRGAADRRRMAALIVLALALEGIATFALHGNGSLGRSVGSLDQPNVLGTYLAMFVCMAAAMVRGVRSTVGKTALVLATLLGLAGIMASVSRGAIVAVGVGLLYVTLRSSRLMTVALLLAAFTSPLWLPADMKERITSTQVEVDGSDEVKLDGSSQKRLDTWSIIMHTVAEHPLDGVGYAGISGVLVKEGTAQGIEGIARTSHNSFLRMLSECGVFGFAVFLWIFWTCLRMGEAGVRSATTRFDRQLGVALGGATLTLAVSSWFGDRFFDIGITGNFWLLAALVQDQLLERREPRP
ncbi:MAG: O-antigen ligase family protein [Candidatus Eisenbacteria bacterium]|uniref:O-antigen ligase family protein n=1 Tax=Eiseniibacteriota bacterium TaxID=2212470 RepID=A0A9D6QIH8_UNCEI|nr:O-antigen ligase family protein [Candidatus Eisenbacteria bacterium]MBI3539377.1 O-antigen ligase family protein [Candidatus Eisenbacteria bacterium]